MFDIDRLIVSFDRGVRTLFAPAHSERRVPGEDAPEPELADAERRRAAALMRVNHTGEVCAQALYQGQALTARSSSARAALERAATEETEHLAWTSGRIKELGGRASVLGDERHQRVDAGRNGRGLVRPQREIGKHHRLCSLRIMMKMNPNRPTIVATPPARTKFIALRL